MKKVLTLIVMAVAFAMPSQAQFSFGVQAGLNLTNISDFSFDQACMSRGLTTQSPGL